MALLQDGIFARLSGFAGLTALVPAARITPAERTQDAAVPAISYMVVSDVPDYAMQNQTGLVRARVQVDAFDDSYSGVWAVAEQIRLALSNCHGTYGGVVIDHVVKINAFDSNEEGTGPGSGTYGVISEFFVDYRQALPS